MEYGDNGGRVTVFSVQYAPPLSFTNESDATEETLNALNTSILPPSTRYLSLSSPLLLIKAKFRGFIN